MAGSNIDCMIPLFINIDMLNLDKCFYLLQHLHMSDKHIIHYDYLSEVFKALSHPLRIEIFLYLASKPDCVCEIAQKFKINKSIASKHLSQMKNAGLISMKKNGTRVEYRIAANCAVDMIACLNKNVFMEESRKLTSQQQVKLLSKTNTTFQR